MNQPPSAVRSPRGAYIQGVFEKPSDPSGEVVSRDPGDLDNDNVAFPFGYDQIHQAVSAARMGFATWRLKSVSERAQTLRQYQAELGKQADALARIVSLETGRPLWDTRLEIAATRELIDSFIQVAGETLLQHHRENAGKGSSGSVRFFPRGVAAVITPLSEPVFQPHTHLLPALLYGNTVVLKSSKSAPFTGQKLAEIFSAAQFPAGALQIIPGDSEVARRLSIHPGVDSVFFTGSHETGMKLQKQLAGDSWKNLVLEMGGKNGVVIWNDAKYEEALYETFLSCYLSTGQRHASASRVLVHKSLFPKFLKDFHALSKKVSVDYGLLEGKASPFFGPLFSEEAFESYVRFQGIAVREGCEEVMRGKALEKQKKGYYVAPSLHIVPHLDAKSVYQKTEVYAPNVALYEVGDLEEVAEILNLPGHSMVHSVYTGSRDVYTRLLEDTRVGLLNLNHPTTVASYLLPRAGLYKSGNNRTMGSLALSQCTYPLSSLEQKTPFQLSDLPPELPRLEVGA